MNLFAGKRWIIILCSAAAALFLWEAAVLIWQFPDFILPSPMRVFLRFGLALQDGSLLRNAGITLFEVLVGLSLGAGCAMLLGYVLAKSPSTERFMAPFLVASQAVPLVAIAPLLVIWFGPGLFSKILICSLIVFFPVLVNTIVGLRAVPENLRDLMLSLGARRGQILRFLEVPASLPVFLGGMRIGATLSVIGAVVGEFVGADRGLGFMINIGRGQYDTALVFVAIFALIFMALGLYGLVILAENRFLRWQEKSTERL